MAAYAALVSLMHIIDDLQHHPRPPIFLHKNQVCLLTQKITFLQEFLEGYNPHLGYSTEADPLETRIADAAYAAEDVIESHIVDQITSDREKFSSDDRLYEALEKVIAEMALIEKEAMEIEGSVGVQDQILDSSRSSSSSIGQKSSMVGVDDAKLQMMDKLTANRHDLQIIPIEGMGGSGKTTLARNIYQERLIKEHFDICAWTTISQEYSIREILEQLLKQLNTEVSQDLNEGILGEMLHKHLYGRKYMIVLDDMWSIKAWDGVRNYFPDNKNGSRIVVTTRLSNLTSELPGSDSLEMELLDEANSWDLLSKTVFGEKACPLELEKIGKKIGKSCKRLPLSIVVVGGLLAKSKHTREFWEHIGENLNAIVNQEDDERCLKILYMSYRQLPVYLKPCFLYMGVFPEDEDIRISRLAKVWAAEGFLKRVSGKSLEEIAKVYLKELIDRNLILIYGLGSIGNTKYCKIHDLVRDLCLREAQKERFYTPQGIVNVGQHRHIVISSNEAMDALLSSSSPSLARSLMWDLEGEAVPPLSFLRLLRILDSCRVQPIATAEFLQNVHHQLVNSRFLDIYVQQAECEFPFPISLFWNLQTLIVDGLMEFTAPTDIWYMPHIRHVQFLWLHLPDPPISQDDVVLENLQSLRTVMNFKCGEQVVKRIPNIKKLVIFYDEVLDDDRYRLTNLDCLEKLESLTCTCPRRTNESLERLISFPDSIKKLSLVVSPSQYWQQILEKIGSLPLLEKLTLESGSFKEGQWETTEGQFRSLKFLAVRECKNLQVWTTESSHFPRLDRLLLSQVDELKEIPLDFAEISTIRVIDVCFGSHSSMVSAKRIVEEQEELYGEAELQVEVTLLRKNEALESLASPNFHVKYT